MYPFYTIYNKFKISTQYKLLWNYIFLPWTKANREREKKRIYEHQYELNMNCQIFFYNWTSMFRMIIGELKYLISRQIQIDTRSVK